MSLAPLLDNYIGNVVSNSQIKGHLGVEIVILDDITCSSSSKIVYLSVTSQIYTNKTYSKTKDIRDPA